MFRLKLSFLAPLLLALPACSEAPAGLSSMPDGPIEIRGLPEGAIVDPWASDLDSTRAVVRSPGEWAALWAPAPPRYPPPPVDFSKDMLLVAAAGARGGHGETIRLESAEVARDTLTVVVREHRGCATTGMIVHPIAIGVVPRMRARVMFVQAPTAVESC